MKGDERVVSMLNQVLRSELTGINQYFMHAKMCQNWGYGTLAKKTQEESIEEMKHADEVMGRILFLDGTPNVQAYDKILVGATVREQLANDLELEKSALKVLDIGIKLCNEVGDTTTRELVERIKSNEEDHIAWIEEQQHLINEVGYELWLSKQM